MPFKHGQSGNPEGRPKGAKTKYTLEEFCKALSKVEHATGKDFFEEVIKMALSSEKMATVVLNKLLANKVEQTNTFDLDWVNQKLTILTANDKHKIRSEVEQYLN